MVRPERDEPQGGLPRNFMRACLLLLLAEETTHGYDLLEKLQGLGVNAADPGGLYRALRAMEQEGLVHSRWRASDIGPARRIYQVTGDGGEWLHAWAGTLRETDRILKRYLKRYDELQAESTTPRRAG